MAEVQLEQSWLRHLQGEFDSEYMQTLKQFLLEQKQAGKTVFPRGNHIFAALDITPLDDVKVVILPRTLITARGKRMA